MSKQIPMSDAARIEASVASKESRIHAARFLSKWFELNLEVSIRLFGVEIFSWHFPPRESLNENCSTD